jgi:L-fuconolactonase
MSSKHNAAKVGESETLLSHPPLGAPAPERTGDEGVAGGIDSHQHFWQFNPVRDSWITDDMHMIRRDFMPEDIFAVIQDAGINGTVIVQSDQSEEENDFQLGNAAKFDFIKGVVGWVDLQDDRVGERLEYYSSFEKMKGLRHVLQGEKNRALMLEPAFKRGISLLAKYGFTYDILIFPDQLGYSLELVKEFPDQPFVVDHIAKPYIKKGDIGAWKRDIQAIAQCPNVYCKISGMVTEADWKNWRKEDLLPYIDVVVNAFGTKRIMFGSDWPVCLVAASYKKWVGLLREYFAGFTAQEQQDFFGNNATRFYKL